MLMTRDAVLSPAHSAAIIHRLRFQLPIVWLVAVAIPGLVVYLGWIPAQTEQAVINSTVGSGIAVLLGLLALRRVNAFPGIKSYSAILPSLASTYGLIVVLSLGLRLPYSRSVLAGSFVLAVAAVFALAYLTERFVRPRFLMVPGGDVERLTEIAGAEWHRLSEPQISSSGQALLVADFRYDHSAEWERMLAHAAINGRIVYHSKLLSESLTGRVTIEHLSENSFGSLLPNLAYRKIKRLLDILLCLVLLPAFALLTIILAALIRMDSPGPVFYRQQRIGYRGRLFYMYKFRSMRPCTAADDDEAARRDAMTRDDDDRVTRFGRFIRRCRLDELPQIFNILRGEMSWIGPRPEAVPLSKWYEAEVPFYSYRHIVRPGISGWAQVNQGHVTDLDSIHQKLSYDFYYVKYFSAWLDIVIAFRTIPTMLFGAGAR